MARKRRRTKAVKQRRGGRTAGNKTKKAGRERRQAAAKKSDQRRAASIAAPTEGLILDLVIHEPAAPYGARPGDTDDDEARGSTDYPGPRARR
jgi:hypothetical protein